ncbi:MAG: hypothetical protein SynsKO_10040 [Synoicihabitans sp.]
MGDISEKNRKWLLEELPGLEAKGILTPDERTRISAYYEGLEIKPSHWLTHTLSALGALLVGGGIILLFAHNWEHLGRPIRTVLAVTPLAVASIFSWWVLGRSTAYRESAGIFHSLAIGAAIALVGQTYHIPSNAPAFFLSWSLLMGPLIFVLSSHGALLIFLGLATSWCAAAQNESGYAIGFWALLAPACYRVFTLLKTVPSAPGTLVSVWGFLISLMIGLGFVMERTIPGMWIIVFSGLLSFIGLLGLRLLPKEQGWSNPLATVGVLGVSTLAYILSWHDVWRNIGWTYQRELWGYQSWGIWTDSLMALLFLTGWGWLTVKSFKAQFSLSLILSIFPIISVLGFTFSIQFVDGEYASGILFNFFMLLMGAAYLIDGCRNIRLRYVNYGMVLLSLLILTRFFDSDFGFFARGIAFIFIGAGFLAANLIVSRRRKSVP